MQARHYLPASGGHFAFEATFDPVRGRYYWPTMHRDVQARCNVSRPVKIVPTPPTTPIHWTRAHSTALLKPSIRSRGIQTGFKRRKLCSHARSVTLFVIVIAVPTKHAAVTTRCLLDYVFSFVRVPEFLHSYEGTKFETVLVIYVQSVLLYKTSRLPPYHSVLERVHSTVHNTLAMYCNVRHTNWSGLLPLIEMAHNTASTTAMHGTP